MLALQLLRLSGETVSLHLIERTGRFGPGLAYGTAHPGHLLNVPAGRMGAFPDRETDFLDWLHARPDLEATPTAATFAPRRHYGAYLRERLLDAWRNTPPGRLNLVHDTVVGIEDRKAALSLRLGTGATILVDAAVLACGNFPPLPIAGVCVELENTRFWRANPWSPSALDELDPAASVLLIGTGLTMVDSVIGLLDRGHTGSIHAVSRRGLLSRSHAAMPTPAAPAERLPAHLLSLARYVRRDAMRAIQAGQDWQPVIDALRPHTQALWHGFTIAEQSRFLRHLRPFWDVHRHRMAPAIAQRIDSARARGQLKIHAGRLEAVRPTDQTVTVRLRLRGEPDSLVVTAARVINCTGAAGDITRVADPLLATLFRDGMVRPDKLRLGLDVTDTCAVRAIEGTPSDRLFAIGPLTKGVWWEIVAVPDIRRQCVAVARHLAEEMARRSDPVMAEV